MLHAARPNVLIGYGRGPGLFRSDIFRRCVKPGLARHGENSRGLGNDDALLAESVRFALEQFQGHRIHKGRGVGVRDDKKRIRIGIFHPVNEISDGFVGMYVEYFFHDRISAVSMYASPSASTFLSS